MRASPVAIAVAVVLAGFTAWITQQAKALERDLDVNSQKIALLDRPAPEFHATALDGRYLSLANYRAKKLVLIFWATWNNGSHPEMTLLSLLYQQNHTPESNYDIIGVAVDDDAAAVKRFANDTRIGFPLVVDHNREFANLFEIRSLPTALILDIDGHVEYGTVGFAQGRQVELARHLQLPPGAFRNTMMMGAPRGRGN